LIYTVDEVSDLLSIPRPTLYRYLREYSIPHLRRSGKISIPEESFDRIREARELHREGLGTESVRRRLREGNELDAEELTERLDQLSEALESLQGNTSPADRASPSQETLQAILERQDLLISTVSNLAERVEDLLETGGQPRKVDFGDPEEGRHEQEPSLEQLERRLETIGKDLTADNSAIKVFSRSIKSLATPNRRGGKFGALTWPRQRGIQTLLLALLAVIVLTGGALAFGGKVLDPSSSDEEQSAGESSRSVPAAEEAPQTVESPDLIGLTLPEAEDELAEAGLKLGAWNEIPSYEMPAGRVVAQDPVVGAEVDPGAPVNLAVSSGPATYTSGTTDSNSGETMDAGQLPDGNVQLPGGELQP